MAYTDLNLGGLSEEELQHITEVLSRDKKLQENTSCMKVAVNNNYASEDEKNQTVNDLVSAEIERVKRVTPVSGRSGRSTPARADSDVGNDTASDEGFFKSIADILTRPFGSMDLSIRAKEKKTLEALAGATVRLNSIPKVPFNYNPRESFRKKPTLLQLAATKANSIESPPTASKMNSALMQYRSSRGDAAFFSTPSGFGTIPRNFRSCGTSSLPIPETIPTRPRSPSLQDYRIRSRPAQSFQDTHVHRISPMPSPILRRPIRKISPVRTQLSNLGFGKFHTPSPTGNDEPFRFFPSPDARESPDGAHTHSPNETIDCLVTPKNNSELNSVTKQSMATSIKSYDSGVHSKSEHAMKRADAESLLGDDESSNHLIIPEYESDSQSLSDFDMYASSHLSDNLSLASVSSSYFDSPVRRALSDRGLGHSDELDEINSMGKTRIQNANAISESKWTNSKGGRLDKKHCRNISAGSNSLMTSDASVSPLLSNKSCTLPSRTILKTDSSLTASKSEDTNTIGNMDISVVYYSSDDLKRKNMKKSEIPRNGTKSTVVPNCHILSRKEYTEVTDANLIMDRSCPSGCPSSIYGELHVTITGAKFQNHLGKMKAPNTYVKCYLLPDKYHNSKMKTAVIKKNIEPRWEHTFILAGFSQSELRERSLEIIVGSDHFKKQEVIGGTVLSVGQGGPHRPWIKSTKAESFIWKTALQISGNKVKALVPLRANMKPTYL